MSETKACNLTESEIKQLIMYHGWNLNDEGKDAKDLDIARDMQDRIERINYLNRRLKEFNKPVDQSTQQQTAANSPEVKG